MTTDDITIYTLRGGGLLLVAGGRREVVSEPVVPDGATLTQVNEIMARHREWLEHAAERLLRPEIDLVGGVVGE
jgi:hypothetical protein